MQSISSHAVHHTSVSILSHFLRLGFPSDLLPLGFLTEAQFTFLSPTRSTCPIALHQPDNIRSTVPTSRSSLHSLLELRVSSSILSTTSSPAPCYVPIFPFPSTLPCPNIPPQPCYVPIFPQHPVMSQYSPAPCYVPIFPSTLLCPNIRQHPVMSEYSPAPCYVPLFPHHPVMSQYSPSPCYVPIFPSTLLCPIISPAPRPVSIIPSFPHTQQFSISVHLSTIVNKKVLIRSANN